MTHANPVTVSSTSGRRELDVVRKASNAILPSLKRAHSDDANEKSIFDITDSSSSSDSDSEESSDSSTVPPDRKHKPSLSKTSIQKWHANSSAQSQRYANKRKQESQSKLLPPKSGAIAGSSTKKIKLFEEFKLDHKLTPTLVLQKEYEAKLQTARDEFELRAREYEARLEAEKTTYQALQAAVKRGEEDSQKSKDDFEARQKEMRDQFERRVKALEEKLAGEEKRHAVSRREIEILKEEKAILIAEKELGEKKARLAALRAQHDAN